MADKATLERLQPSLLDRLTDDAPGERQETRAERAIDIERLREIVRRDLSWLLNTQNNEFWLDPKAFPRAANSVLNYGVRAVSGEYATAAEAERIRRSILTAIERFEPRIREGTADVVLNAERRGSAAILAYDIRAEIWATPVPLEIHLRTEIDITTGEVTMEREG